MGDFEEMAWPSANLTETKAVTRYAILAGTVINAFNERDGVKYRQEMSHDFFFTKDDVFPQEEDGIYRVRLNKGEWSWFEVDVMDLHDVTLVSRRKAYEDSELMKKQSLLEKELANEMHNEITKELNKQVIENLRKAFEKIKPAQGLPSTVKPSPYDNWTKYAFDTSNTYKLKEDEIKKLFTQLYGNTTELK